MKSITKIVLTLFISMVVLQSCSNHSPAPVKDLSKSKNSYYYDKYRKTKRFKKEYVKVKKGDTLYSIGFANDVDYKKLAILNNIKAPYNIYPGQKIKLKGRVTVLTKVPKNTGSNNKSNGSLVKTSPVVTKTFNPKVKTHKNPVTTNPVKKQVVTKPVAKVPVQKQPVPEKIISKLSVKKAPVKIQPTPVAKSNWIWPVKGRLLSSFSSSDTSRKGIKIATTFGKPVYASNNGTVVYSGDGLRGYGELVIIKHSNNLLSAYAHNSKRFVKEGEAVKQGQEIAKSGKGNDGKPLLHFEIRKNGQPVNPVKYLPK